MAFFQTPPELGNQYDDDRVMRFALDRYAGPDVARALAPELREMGALAVGRLAELGNEAERDLPRHVPFDAYGRRIDRVDISPAWTECLRVAAERGVVGSAYETTYGDRARLHQWALLHLFAPSTATALCPLAMTDGVARTLLVHADEALAKRVAGHLTSRDRGHAWTAGQWMTEREGGSDVGRTATRAVLGTDGTWRLSGTKWFTSAVTADCALLLARPDPPGEPGSRPLALFYVEVTPQVGRTDGAKSTIRVNRLKDKLGTKALPTAELELDDCVATLVGETTGGVRRITTLLNIARF
ncbi:MAG: acyl-CoA dehydrogenase family protein, partial [Deltaproteobacteria bacterium]|nr:acyl-CoA dehydrogenase family protein [Deltaproteobacteria bacterium]